MSEKTVDYYAVLGISPDATRAEVRAAWHALAIAHHPSRNSGPESARLYALANEAWSLLGDEVLRAEYDRGRAQQRSTTANTARTALRNLRRRAARATDALRQRESLAASEKVVGEAIGDIRQRSRQTLDSFRRFRSRADSRPTNDIKPQDRSRSARPPNSTPDKDPVDQPSDEKEGSRTENRDQGHRQTNNQPEESQSSPAGQTPIDEAPKAMSEGLWARIGGAFKRWSEEARRHAEEREQLRREAAWRRWEKSRRKGFDENREPSPRSPDFEHQPKAKERADADADAEQPDPNWKRYWNDLRREANIREGRDPDFEGNGAFTFTGLAIGCLGGIALGVFVGLVTLFIGFIPIVVAVTLLGICAGSKLDNDFERRRVAKATGMPLDWVTEIHRQAGP